MMNKFKNGLGHSLVLAGMCLAMLLFMSHKSVAQEVGEVGYMYTPDAQTTFRYVITAVADGEGNGGEVAVRKYNDNVSGAIEIPSSVTITVNEANITYAVTAVRADGFKNCASITGVTIPNSVTVINGNAFQNCTSLASVSLVGSGVTSIGQNAFGSCSALTSVTFNDALSTIGRRAFRSSGLTSVTIPSSVTSIGNGAFSNCGSLTSVTIQDGITSIGDSVFESSSLASVTFPSSVTSIGAYAFASCPLSSQGTLDLSNVTSLGEGAFQTGGNGGITSVTFSSSLTTIPQNAFRNRGLTSVTIPSSVTTIGASAFSNCWSLTSVTIPASVTTIGNGAFSDCGSLTSVTFPSSVTSIGAYAFTNCPLTSQGTLDLSNVTSLGDGAFQTSGSGGITSVTFSSSLTTIPQNAFRGRGLTSVTIPSSVTTIGQNAFYGCYNMTDVTFERTESAPTIADVSSFSHLKAYTTTFHVPTGMLAAYKTALHWTENDSYHNAPMSGLYYIIEGDGVAVVTVDGIRYTVLDAANRKAQVASYNSVSGSKTIASAVSGFGSGDETSQSYEVTTIGASAFRSSGLTSVTIPSSVTTIGASAFSNCWSLTSVTIPASVTTIGNGAFSDCGSLTSVTIPSSVTSIGAAAFASCSLNSQGTLDLSNVTSLGDGAFQTSGSGGITSVTFSSSLTTIPHNAFRGRGLTSVTIPSSVTTIGQNAFYGCYNMTDVTFERTASAPTIADVSSFSHLKAYTTTFHVPTEMLAAYKTALHWTENDSYHNAPMSGLYYIVEGDGVAVVTVDGIRYTVLDAANRKAQVASYNSVSGSKTIASAVSGFGSGDETSQSYEVTAIGNYAFFNCGSLTSVTIQSSVTSIGQDAFRNCYALTSITIPSSVTTIGSSAFYGCQNMTDVTFERTESAPTIANVSSFSHLKAYTTTFHVPTGKLAAYKTALHWTENDGYHNAPMSDLYYIMEGDGVAVVTVDGIRYTVLDAANRKAQVASYNSVSGSKTIASAVSGFGSGDETSQSYEVTTIIAYAFRSSGLTSVTIPSSVTSIGNGAFSNCGSLTSVTIPSSVTSIGAYAFTNCPLNSQGTLDLSNVTSLGEGAFQYGGGYNGGITSVTFSSSLTTIPQNAFRNRGLTSVNIPASVTSIGAYAFRNCTDLVDVTFQGTTPPSIPLIADNFIDNTPLIEHIYVPCANLATYKSAYTSAYIPQSRVDKIYPLRSGEAIASTLTSDLNLTGEDCDCKAIPSTLTISDNASLSFKDYTNFVAAMKDVTINVEKELNVDEWNLISALNGTRVGETYAFLDNNLGQTSGVAHAMAAVPYDFAADKWGNYVSRTDNTPIASQSFMVYPVNVALTTDGNTGTVSEDLNESKITLTQTISGNEVNEKNNIYIPLTTANSEKWYPLANPYIGRLNLNKFHTANAGNLQDNYAWIFKDGDWEGVDISGATNYAIYPASGFLVSLPEISSETELNMHVNQIVTDESVTMKSTEGNNKITLSATNNGVEKEIYAHIDEVSDNGYGRLDAKVMFSSNEDAVNPYFNVEGRNIFDNYFSQLPAEYELNFNSYKNNQIDFALKEEISEIEVTLIDIANNNAETVLSVNEPVQIDLTEGQNEGRYRLRFAPKNSNINGVASSENNINIWNRLSEINISGKDLKRVEIFNTLGQKVYHAQLSGDSATFNSNLSDGAYIVKVYTQSSIKSKKVIIR